MPPFWLCGWVELLAGSSGWARSPARTRCHFQDSFTGSSVPCPPLLLGDFKGHTSAISPLRQDRGGPPEVCSQILGKPDIHLGLFFLNTKYLLEKYFQGVPLSVILCWPERDNAVKVKLLLLSVKYNFFQFFYSRVCCGLIPGVLVFSQRRSC